jgi:hypothetical protein
MRKIIALVVGAAACAALATGALADTAPPATTPFPASSVGPVFIAGQTVNTSGAMASAFAPGSTVVFRAYAVDTKTGKSLVAKTTTYFYVTIPGQPNVKLKYDTSAPGATTRMPWTGSWTVPANYAPGIVGFKILAKATSKRTGSFVQIPVSTSQLTVSSTAVAPFGPGPTQTAVPASDKFSLGIYVDTVNGTGPVGAAKRLVGCAQTNVFKRGEQVVFRVWGFDLKSGDTLSTDNVDTATVTLPGVAAPLTLNYGAHGATGAKVWFWSSPWIVPPTYPLGDVPAVVTFKTDAGQTGTFAYGLTIVPS